jgi:hypothetical protein
MFSFITFHFRSRTSRRASGTSALAPASSLPFFSRFLICFNSLYIRVVELNIRVSAFKVDEVVVLVSFEALCAESVGALVASKHNVVMFMASHFAIGLIAARLRWTISVR